MATEVYVSQATLLTGAEGDEVQMKGTKRGEICVIDFLTEMVMEQNAFQVRMGTVTTAITADATLADTAAECAISAQVGTTIIPVTAWITLNNEGADANEITLKSVNSVHTAGTGTIFSPLPLFSGGRPAVSTAEVQTAGGVTVPAEVVTTCRRHYYLHQEFVKDSGTEWRSKNLLNAMPRIGGNKGWIMTNPIVWTPAFPPVLAGAACFYYQHGSASTAPGYFAHIDYLDLPTTSVS